MTRAAYFECFAGASGDMILGALLDAGWPEQDFLDTLRRVPLSGWDARVNHVKKGALRATQVTLRATEPQPERDVRDIVPILEAATLPAAVIKRAIALFHELADVEGLEHDQPPETVHFHEVGAVDSILDIVGACAGLHALGIERLYVSPINVGGGTVSTRDGILPVPGPATLELLRRKGAPLYASEYGPEFLTPTGALILATLADGFGPFPLMRVERIGYGAGHKDFTIPNVLRVSTGELYDGGRGRRFMATPTPAATINPSTHGTHGHEHGDRGEHAHTHPPSGGHGHDDGAGKHEHEHEHVSHEHTHVSTSGTSATVAFEQTVTADGTRDDVVVQLETNIDDMNPEWYGHLSERLFGQGALDVTLTPVYMKKGRPGTLVSVLVAPETVEPALDMLFDETTTLGVRVQPVMRRRLERRVAPVETPYGTVRVKFALQGETLRSAAPEYEDCRRIAVQAGVTLRQVYDAAARAALHAGRM